MTVACQAPLSMGFPRQEYWSRLPFPSPGDLPDPGIKPLSPALAGGFFITEPPGKPAKIDYGNIKSIVKDSYLFINYLKGSPGDTVVKNPPANAGDTTDVCSIPGSGRCSKERHGNPIQYSCLEKSMNRGAWWATVSWSHKESDMTKLLRTHSYSRLKWPGWNWEIFIKHLTMCSASAVCELRNSRCTSRI